MSEGVVASGPLSGLRVLELTQRYPPALGGVERYVERLVGELSRAGATVTVATSDLGKDRPFTRASFGNVAGPAEVRRHRARLVAPTPQGTGVVVPGMLRDALRLPVDVVHAHAFGHFPLWAGRVAQSLRGVPLIVTPHSDRGRGTFVARQWSRYVGWTSVRGADITVALSHVEASWLGSIGVRAERIRVIPAAIDLSEFIGLPVRAPSGKARRVLFVGRLDTAQKGLEELVRAMAMLPRTLNASVTLVGEDWGSLAPTLTLAKSLGIGDRVRALGAVSRAVLLQEFAAADVFVLPSRFDSFPVVVVEAMAAGLPVVATRVGGLPEMIEEGRSGLLVPPGSPSELADALRMVLTDASVRARFSTEGRLRARRFDWSVVGPEYIRLFSEARLLGRQRERPGDL